ncbi:branched-chain amino acid ABC transporter permease [Streptomyces sp. SID3343]|uniref:branched-chain amino acid ABC transporter permease n=1 Tax=Streptomyces sp. SID3343 TaxID=2690260 RepID=UPI001370D1C6|nr:branched-chain amino acid ABC transporter permease [Streptomyces sp. SID3343]MYW06277.1 branched-chain amino acid ABC transporter permease [Streptomyces sp. SID3343]
MVLPFYVTAFWLQTGLFTMAAAIGAVGLNVLSGTTGQLSLGHAFFLAFGAYGYVWFAGDSGRVGVGHLSGLGLPPLVALVSAVLLTGLVGGLFSPVSGRLRGMYLGVATLALVFIGHHVMLNAKSITGGFDGRSVTPMDIGGFSFTDGDPDGLEILGIPFGRLERLWYFALVLVVVACVTARNLLRGRPGRALGAVRDSEIAAAVMGVPVARYRSAAFVVSSMYAGLAGALIAMIFNRVVPDYFGLLLSIDYLAMIVIGGLGSVTGAVVGAVFVTMLPQILSKYADSLPLVVAPGSPDAGVGPGEAARYLYGAAIVLVLLFAPGGLVGLLRGRPGGDPGGRPLRLGRTKGSIRTGSKEQPQ